MRLTWGRSKEKGIKDQTQVKQAIYDELALATALEPNKGFGNKQRKILRNDYETVETIKKQMSDY